MNKYSARPDMVRRLFPIAFVFSLLFGFGQSALGQVMINEVDADQVSTDSAEFIELYDGGVGNSDLSGMALVLYNGSDNLSYIAFDLDGHSTGGDGYFVLCGNAANVANCDLDVSPDTNLIQNGEDAVTLLVGDAASYPNDTALPNDGDIVDAIVYETGSDSDSALLVLLNAGQGVVDEGGNGDQTGHSNQRCSNGSGGARNTDTYLQAAPSPGADNNCDVTPPIPDVIINEVDADQVSTDSAEFVELYDGGVGNTDLSGLSLVMYNGSDDLSYIAFDLDGQSTDGDGYFVLCGNAANVANCNLDVSPDTNLIQNGEDAVALIVGDAINFPNDTALPADGDIVDGIVYETGSDSDSGLLVLLNAGQGVVNEGGGGDQTGHSNQRCSNGSGGARNTDTYTQAAPSPGAANTCIAPPVPDVIINEVDADQTSTDSAEFVELYDGGVGNTDLTGLALVLYNGSDDQSYIAFDLDGQSTDGDGYFVLCGNAANVANCDLDVSPDTNLIQNGADAVALLVGDAVNYPNDTALPADGDIVDAIVYDTNDSDDAGLLVLLNAGQTQVNEGGNGDNIGHSNQRCANGSGGARNTATYDQFVPTPGAENICEIPVVGPFEIFQIQGAGSASPFVGQTVITNDNVVTAIGPNGFTMQTPAVRSDADVNTSDGIYVFTGAAPAVALGDTVNVTGSVVEFFGFTEFSGSPDVTVVSSGGALPPAVIFDTNTPSPDPASPSCSIEYECYEGMLVQITDGSVTGPNQRFGVDPIAEVHITAAPNRTYREPGIEFPGMAGLPVWDGNPEVFELDPDKMGLPNQIIPAGSGFSATGVIGFEFGGYELWPTALTVTAAIIPQSVRPRAAGEFSVGSLNLFRLFDDIDDAPTMDVLGDPIDDFVVSTPEYQRRLSKFASYIVQVIDSPDILAVQEVEKHAVLVDLAAAINAVDPAVNYSAYLEEGNDLGSIDVGFLVRDTVAVDAVTQLGATEVYFDPVNLVNDILHDRPPLLLEGRSDGNYPLKVIVVHNRSLGGIDSSDGARVREKRFQQAQSIAEKVQQMQTDDPDVRLVVTGDFNAFEFSDSYVDAVGQIRGDVVPADNLLSGPDLVSPNLLNQVLSLPPAERYSFIFRGNAQVLDHALTSMALDMSVRGMEYGRGNADAAADLINDNTTPANIPLRSSDHDGLVLFISMDQDADGVNDDLDDCPMTNAGEVVNADGCSIADLSPCENDWKNHGAYVRNVAHTSEDFVAAGLITEEEKDAIVSAAGRSSCGAKK